MEPDLIPGIEENLERLQKNFATAIAATFCCLWFNISVDFKRYAAKYRGTNDEHGWRRGEIPRRAIVSGNRTFVSSRLRRSEEKLRVTTDGRVYHPAPNDDTPTRTCVINDYTRGLERSCQNCEPACVAARSAENTRETSLGLVLLGALCE